MCVAKLAKICTNHCFLFHAEHAAAEFRVSTWADPTGAGDPSSSSLRKNPPNFGLTPLTTRTWICPHFLQLVRVPILYSRFARLKIIHPGRTHSVTFDVKNGHAHHCSRANTTRSCWTDCTTLTHTNIDGGQECELLCKCACSICMSNAPQVPRWRPTVQGWVQSR